MGVVREAQDQGVGKWLMGEVIDQARARGDRVLTLEVIEQNPRAVRVYERCGFVARRRLLGFAGENLTGSVAPLESIDVAQAATKISAWSMADLPWPCSGESLAHDGPPGVAYRLGESCAILSDPSLTRITLRGFAVPPEQQGKGAATRLLAAVLAAHPGKHWQMPAVCPEELQPISFATASRKLDCASSKC